MSRSNNEFRRVEQLAESNVADLRPFGNTVLSGLNNMPSSVSVTYHMTQSTDKTKSFAAYWASIGLLDKVALLQQSQQTFQDLDDQTACAVASVLVADLNHYANFLEAKSPLRTALIAFIERSPSVGSELSPQEYALIASRIHCVLFDRDYQNPGNAISNEARNKSNLEILNKRLSGLQSAPNYKIGLLGVALVALSVFSMVAIAASIGLIHSASAPVAVMVLRSSAAVFKTPFVHAVALLEWSMMAALGAYAMRSFLSGELYSVAKPVSAAMNAEVLNISDQQLCKIADASAKDVEGPTVGYSTYHHLVQTVDGALSQVRGSSVQHQGGGSPPPYDQHNQYDYRMQQGGQRFFVPQASSNQYPSVYPALQNGQGATAPVMEDGQGQNFGGGL